MMKFFSQAIILSALFIVCISAGNQKKIKVVFFGDSITESGAKPGGFIEIMKADLQTRGMADKYELIGAGVSGDKVYDLYLRMDNDVMAKSPDVLIIWIGVNDVWHKASMGTGTDANKFERFYTAIIKKLQEKKITVLLTTPAVIGERTDNTNQLDGDLNKYANIIRSLATNYQCGLVDLRKDFLSYNLKNNPTNKESGILTTDRVHLNVDGNRLVAEKMMDALNTMR
jgi:lysophospholipase L1-like esterase